jgi:hypothetical protein
VELTLGLGGVDGTISSSGSRSERTEKGTLTGRLEGVVGKGMGVRDGSVGGGSVGLVIGLGT